VVLLLQYSFMVRNIPFYVKQKKRSRSIAHSCWLQRDLSCTGKGFAKGARVKRQGNGTKGKGPTLEKAKGAWLALLSVVGTRPLCQPKRLQPPSAEPTPEPELPKGWLRPEPAATLLATPRRQKLLEHIWQRTSLSRQQFNTLYLAPLHRYAELAQQFPASESHHHAYPGGMLDHGLEIVAYALKLRQSHLLPADASPEDQAAQSEVWTATTAYAALLHDIGKIAVDIEVELIDGSVWHPWHGTLQQPYRFRYREGREYRLHSAATGLLHQQILDRHILDWLCAYPDLWASLLYVLAGQYEHAGILGELVIQADRASVAQALGGDPARALAAPKSALQRKLLDGLRYLLKHELKLNQPQASDGWLTDDALWLVSKTVSDKLRAHLLAPRQQHRRLQRFAGTRHAATHAGRQSHLESNRHQRHRLVTQLYPAASGSGSDLGSQRTASGVCGDGCSGNCNKRI